jgi:hypothetical protein
MSRYTHVPPSGSYRNLLRGFEGSELQHLQVYLSGVLFVAALRAQAITVDSHLFSHGEHGAGLAERIPEESSWPEIFQQWLVRQQFLSK